LLVLQVIARVNLGGTAKYLFTLSEQLPKIGIKTIIVTGHVQGDEIEDPGLKKVDHIHVENLARKINIVQDIKAALNLRRVLIDLQPDVIHTHTFKAGLLVRIQRNKLEQILDKKIMFIHTFHGHLFDDPQFKGPKAILIAIIERYLAKKCDQVVTVGEIVKEDLEKRRIKGKSRTISIPPAVSPLKLKSKKNALVRYKVKNKSRIRVLWMARVTGVKNPMRALRIARQLPELDFYLAGGGDLLSEVKNSAPKNMKVLGWQQATDLLPIADIVLSTSENEGMPIALIESQLASLPVVATNVGSVSEVVINNKTGFICKKNDNQLIESLRELANNRSLRVKFGRSARLNSSKAFSIKIFIEAHKKLYLQGRKA
jgi:glycosyltransferase involved in cell wall biosynthesis